MKTVVLSTLVDRIAPELDDQNTDVLLSLKTDIYINNTLETHFMCLPKVLFICLFLDTSNFNMLCDLWKVLRVSVSQLPQVKKG